MEKLLPEMLRNRWKVLGKRVNIALKHAFNNLITPNKIKGKPQKRYL